MIHIKVVDEKIEFMTDEEISDEGDMLKSLNKVLCFTIAIYKHRIERINQCKLSRTEEIIIDQRIKDALVIVPLDEVRDFINEVR